MKRMFSVLVSVLMLVSIVSAAFVGAGLPFKTKKNTQPTINDNKEENIIKVFKPVATPEPEIEVEKVIVLEAEPEEEEEQAEPEEVFNEVVPKPVEDEITITKIETPGTRAVGDQMQTLSVSKDHSVVIVGLYDGSVYAYDSNTMQELWHDTAAHSGAIQDIQFDGIDTVYTSATDGKIARFNSSTGAPYSGYPFTVCAGQEVFSIDIEGDDLYAGCGNGRVYKFNKDTRVSQWSGGIQVFDTNAGAWWDNAYSVRYMNGNLYATGGTGYTYEITPSGTNNGIVYEDANDAADGAYASKIYATEAKGNQLYIADSTDYTGGAVVTDGDLEGVPANHIATGDASVIYDMAIDGNTLYTARYDGKVGVWDINSNSFSTSFDAASGNQMGGIDVNDNYIFTGSKENKMKWFDKTTYAYVNEKSYSQEVTQVAVEATTTNTNEVPEWESQIPDVSRSEDSGAYTVDSDLAASGGGYATDFEGTALTFTVEVEDTAEVDCTTSGASLSITPAADWSGTASCTIRASDGTDYADDTFEITISAVNDAPVYAGTMVAQPLDEEAIDVVLFDLDNHFTDVDSTLTYTATSGNTDLVTVSVNGNNEVVATAPTADLTGTTVITIEATDGSLTATGQFDITVNNLNDAPVYLGGMPNRDIAEDSFDNILFDLDNYFSDPDGETLTYTVDSDDTSLVTVSTNANNEVVASTATADATGTVTVTVTAEDDDDATAEGTFDISVTAVGDGPIFSGPIDDQNIDEDTSNNPLFDADTYFTDADGDTLDYEASGYNTALVTISIDPTTNEVSASTVTTDMTDQTEVTITATDGVSIATGTFTLIVDPINDAPTVANTLPDVQVNEGSTGNNVFANDLDYYFDDVDSTLSYAVEVGYDTSLITVTINATNHVIVNAADNVLDFTDVTISASDGTLTVTDVFRVTTVETNDAPVLDPIGDLTAYVNVPFSYTVSATDDDGDTLTFYNAPNDLFTIDSASGVISFTPDESMVDAYTITFSVSDGFLQDSEEITFNVVDQDLPVVAITSPIATAYPAAPELWFTVSEPATCVYSLNSGADAPATNGTVLAAVEGPNEVTVTCTDPSTNEGSDTVNFNLDTIAPVVSITNPANYTNFSTSSVQVDWTGSVDIVRYEVQVAGGGPAVDVGLDTSRTFNLADMIDHMVTVTGYDAAGNTGDDIVYFTVDTVAPDVTIDDPNEGDYILTSNVPFNMNWSSVATDIEHYEVNGTDVGLANQFNVNLPDGTYMYNVSAYDFAGNMGSDTVSFTIGPVINLAPTLDTPLPNRNIPEDTFNNFLFDLDNYFSDPNGDALLYTVDNIGDPTLVAINIAVNGSVYADTVTLNAFGASTVRIMANDTEFTVTDEFVVFVDEVNDAPVSSFTANATTISPGQTIQFDGSASSDVDGSIVNYAWDFDEGAGGPVGAGAPGIVTNTFNTIGTYNVTLTVTDDDGANGVSNMTIIVVVLNQPPVPILTAPAQCYVNGPCDFGVNATDDVGVSWFNLDYNDTTGLSGAWAGPFTVTHNYAATGSYNVTLWVNDTTGLEATTSAVVNVVSGTGIPPNASMVVNSTIVTIGEGISFNGSGSTDDLPEGIYSYAWDFDDGSTDTGNETVYAYPAAGLYLASLTVTDYEGLTDTATVLIAVHDPTNPQADLAVHDAGFWLDNYAPVIGNTVNANLNVYNLGGVDTNVSSDNFTVRVNDTAGGSGATVVTNIAAGTMQTVAVPWTALGVSVNITGVADYFNNVTESDETNNQAMLQLYVGANYNPTQPAPGSGPSGSTGSTSTVPVINPDPTTNVTIPPTPEFIDDLITYRIGDFVVTRDYFYNPNTDEGWYTMHVENVGDQDYVIELEDPNPYDTTADTAPDYTVGNRLAWELDMSVGETFEVTYDFEGKLSTSQVKAVGAPVINDITPVPEPDYSPPTPTPEPEEEESTNPLTGFLTFMNFDWAKGWTTTLVLLALVVLISVAWVLFKEQGYALSVTGSIAENATFEELDFNQPSGYAEGTLY